MDLENALLTFALSIVLLVIQQQMSKNREAREKCLDSLGELEDVLEKLNDHMRSTGRIDRSLEFLKEIKGIIRQIVNGKTGLVFSSAHLDLGLIKSRTLLRQLNPSHTNLAYHPIQIASQMIMLWGISDQPHASYTAPVPDEVSP